jgi:hypothetical protein
LTACDCMSCLPFGFVLCVGAATAAAGGHPRIGLLPIARVRRARPGAVPEPRSDASYRECADLQRDEPGALHPHRRVGKAVHR